MRTVLGFEPFGDRTVLKLREAPAHIPGLGTNELTDVTDPGGTVTSRGKALLERLRRHPVVSQGLAAALAQPPAAGPGPLYLHMVSNEADQLPWEQLLADPQGFIALDARWPIARIAAFRSPVDRRTFTPPLRIVAVLSAAQRTGVPQLQALLAATALPDAREIGTRLHVISAEQDVLDAFSNDSALNSVILLDHRERPVAALDRARFLLSITGPYGHALYAKRPARKLADPPKTVPCTAPALAALRIAGSDRERVYDDLVAVNEFGQCMGVVHVGDIIRGLSRS